jgi:hypothetical protein
LRAELGRVADGLARCLARQRQRGRTPAGDPVRGLVIEEGETEGLLAELTADLGPSPGGSGKPASLTPRLREEIAERAAQGAAQGAFLPLRHAVHAFELTDGEYDVFLLALAVEIDARFGRLVAYLNDHVARTRPTLGLALALAALDNERPLTPVGLEDRPLFRDGLLETEGDGPLPGVALKVPPSLVPRLAGVAGARQRGVWLSLSPAEPGLLDRLILTDDVRRELRTWGEALRTGRTVPPLLVEGSVGTGRSTAARAAAFVAGRPVVQIELAIEGLDGRLRAARRESRWHGAALLLKMASALSPAAAALDWRAVWAAVPERPLLLGLTPDDAALAAGAAPEEPVVVRLEDPDVGGRQALWGRLLAKQSQLSDRETAELAGRFRFGPSRITRAIRRANADLLLRPPGERALDFAALLAAARVIDSAALGPLAQKLPLPYERSELIVPPAVDAELDLAVAWVRHRHQVLQEWGFQRRVPMGHGLTALFAGKPGTGKTMAAQVLARELGLDLYRIDLSQVMSKFIGETEKNLARLFDARVGILFFDEAEAILGKRSEVKDAHDRYANIEIGYLLQRMEEYDGVTILATNRARDMDEAFMRRLQVVVDFPMPAEPDRLRIWQGMLPAAADRQGDLDLAALARQFEGSGGEIKNAALAAAYLAAAEGHPIGMDHLRRAVKREMVKGGKVVEG